MKSLNGLTEFKIGDCRVFLPGHKDGEFELAITDPPYNIDKSENLNPANKDPKVYFNDKFEHFFGWVDSWFPQLMRVCNGIVLTPGCAELANWITYRKPDYQIRIWHKPNATGFNSHWEPVLFYGKVRNYTNLRDVINMPMPPASKKMKFGHPAYKPFNFWLYLFDKLQPGSVLDPFLGSGTSIQAAEQLGIKFQGYELEPEYEKIILRRQELGIKARMKPQQRQLHNFISPPVNSEVTKLP